ncbi:hypothetical protein SEA_LENNON_3 [Gordonia phage Lennon]|uniref:Uncharacterized protein n=5 Tax=Vividuovirus TaxID=2560251 RepID=A0A2U9PFI5_9CAUD|nr:hypothetical protein FDI74_gp03 [Gordonia phage Lennon]YP_010099163.1 hypothetical protein KNU18_gp03 [Gordonia phage Bibwit]YP_010099502.1 hypothetical protein KNU22_gp03 [Gordonia phage Stultus]YP_010104499.1 hypothetical protein KNU77_gp03 [Gordonia phage Keitabear]AWT50502.1 hypothetical protein PBI_SITAR_3 [Gordonia phage Sitar]QWT30133.1 hypothetical protein SEA_SEDONA_3 [Gordonia phage Sedona]UYL87678.1 hypothetical protein SEA_SHIVANISHOLA_3 [Gordonia phage Shivanishola]ATN90197.1
MTDHTTQLADRVLDEVLDADERSTIVARVVDPVTGSQLVVCHTEHGAEFRIINPDGGSYYIISDTAHDLHNVVSGIRMIVGDR